MIKSINNSVLALIAFALFGCSNKQQEKVANGYLNSAAYKEYLKPDKVDSNYGKQDVLNADYSVKRMFMLLGEEGFLYNSEYDLYAIYAYMRKGGTDTIDYYILKSKDSIYSFSRKILVDVDRFLYVNKVISDTSYKKGYDLEVTTKLVEDSYIQSASRIFEEAISVVSSEPKYFGPYGGPLRCLYLYYKNEYHFMTDHKLQANMMQKIDSLFKSSL